MKIEFLGLSHLKMKKEFTIYSYSEVHVSILQKHECLTFRFEQGKKTDAVYILLNCLCSDYILRKNKFSRVFYTRSQNAVA